MCGIVGTFSYAGLTEYDSDWVYQAIHKLEHRGPEGNTFKILQNYMVAHASLSFFNIGQTDQPYRSTKYNTIIAFNGELYNYKQLLIVLRQNNIEINRATESEIIAALYFLYGSSFIDQLSGMFAISIYDIKRKRLLLYRDKVGKKPLHYCATNTGVYFSSEMMPLLSLTDSCISNQVLNNYLMLQTVPADQCLIQGIEKLAPGEMVIISEDSIQRKRYWEPISCMKFNAFTVNTVGQLDNLLNDAIKTRLGSGEFKQGIALSGGLDSSLITAMLCKNFPEYNIEKCYSISFEEESYDEFHHAKIVTDKFGLRHQRILFDQSKFHYAVTKYLSRQDEPNADPSFLGLSLLAETAHFDGCKAVISGDGADDVFMGYSYYKVSKIMYVLNKLRYFIPVSILEKVINNNSFSYKNLSIKYVLSLIIKGVKSPASLRHAHMNSAFSQLKFLAASGNSLNNMLNEYNGILSHNEQAQVGMFFTFLQSMILPKLDMAGMLNNIEIRSPFLDASVVDYGLNINENYKLNKGMTKYIVRQLAVKYLGEDFAYLNKKGFRLPMNTFLRDGYRERIYDSLSSRKSISKFIPKVNIHNLLDNHFNEQQDNSKEIWTLFCLQCWYEKIVTHQS